MLREITIENVAVIEKATANFGKGFNVLTGETGAGKSILIDSINAILGSRTSRDIVRSGAAKASIWASFEDIAPATQAVLNAAGYDCDSELLLYREISADGKSNCRINGAPATAAMLREICSGLINIHGQHDNHSLLNPAKHLGLLDVFAQNDALKMNYRDVYAQFSKIRREIEALSMNEAEKTRKLDLLRYEVEEIELADLNIGEDDELNEKRNLIRHSQHIVQALNNAYMALYGDDDEAGAASLLGSAANEMLSAAQYSTDLSEYADSLNEAYYTISEIASDLASRLSDFDFNPHEIDDIEHRLDIIYRLQQKYGGSVKEIIAYGEKARVELEDIEFASEKIAKLELQKKALEEKTLQLASALSASRTEAFTRLDTQITKALTFLNMPNIVLALQHNIISPGSNGQDEIEFFISTNPGESPKPLAKIASGGELSRIMLALKSALADRDDIATVIYDEIDTGVSGLAAGRIGKLLHYTATGGRQVICVTHTAQIAAFAQNHLLIEKQIDKGRTFTHIRALDNTNREQELARIISGDNITELSRANAAEMLRLAKGVKLDG